MQRTRPLKRLARICGGLKGDSDGPHAGLHAPWPLEQAGHRQLINYSRDELPIHNRISNIAGRTANITSAILRKGGKKIEKDEQIIHVFPDGNGD